MRSASNRFDLLLALSGGWDSRLVLASCEEIKHKISYMSKKKLGMSENDPDLVTSSRLMAKLGLKHDIVEVDPDVRSEFLEIFNKNVSFPHIKKNAAGQQAILDYYNHSNVAVVGNVSEVARCYHGPTSKRLSARKVSALMKVEAHPFAIKSFEKWLSGLGEVYNFNVLDLLHWEQKDGRWLAMDHLEYDIAWRDIFTPYNSRDLLANLLSVDPRLRMPPKFELYQKLIFSSWPEVLSEPIYSPRYEKKLIRDQVERMRRYARSLKRKLLQACS